MSASKSKSRKIRESAVRDWRIDITAPLSSRHLGRKLANYAKAVLVHLELSGKLGRGKLVSRLKNRAITGLSIVLTDDRKIRVLNRDYRRKDKPTDVLSFSMLEGECGDVVPDSLGDLVISLETARRQAREYGVTLKAELHRLVIHGILHLCGYDHEGVSAAEANRMRRMERAVLELV